MEIKSVLLSSNKRSLARVMASFSFISHLKKSDLNVAFFKPFVTKKDKEDLKFAIEYFGLQLDLEDAYAFCHGGASEKIANNKKDEIFEKIIEKHENLKSKFDFIVCDGVFQSELSTMFDFNFNIKIAQNLNLPIVNVIEDGEFCYEKAQRILDVEKFIISSNDCVNVASLIQSDEDIKADHPIYKLPSIACFDYINDKTALKNAIESFENCIDMSKLLDNIKSSKPTCITASKFAYDLFQRAKSDIKTIVLPESQDDRILKAADILQKKNAVKIILLGDSAVINKRSSELGLELKEIQIINPQTSEFLEEFANSFYDLRKSKGVTFEQAQDIVKNQTYFGTMLVHLGYADGMVSGAANTTADTIRPAFQIIKTKPGISVVSSTMFVCLDTKVLAFGDCAVNPNPTPEEAAQIAITSAKTVKSFGIDPRIAMLSYSTGSSGTGPDVDAVKNSTELVKKNAPELKVEGPIQYDASVDMVVGSQKMPNSEVAGKANVFIFPDLQSGNIAYKVAQRSAKALAVGPVLQGLRKPINDLSRGCLVEDIVNLVAITAIQSQGE